MEMLRRSFPDVIVIQNDINIGFGKANNQAIGMSRGNFILILNPDIVLEQDTFSRMIEFLKMHPDVGCTGTRLINRNGSIQKSYFGKFPTAYSELREGLMVDRLYNSIFNKNHNASEDMEVAWVVGACMLFRRHELLKLGGFDERFYMYGEDIDLCYRVKKSGLKIYYLGTLEMVHFHAAVSKKKSKKYFGAVLQRESVYKFMRSHYGLFHALSYRLSWIIGGLVRIIFLAFPYLLTTLTAHRSKLMIHEILEKYYRIVSWGLGKEKWTKQPIPD
jgi:GT2 family glycosyltransferase